MKWEGGAGLRGAHVPAIRRSVFCAFCQEELEKQMRSDVFLFSLNEGNIHLICYTNIRHFSVRASLCLVKSGKMSYFLRLYCRKSAENAAVARERRKKKHTSTWSLQGRWTYRARKGRSNACFGRYLFVLNSPIRCSYRHQPG